MDNGIAPRYSSHLMKNFKMVLAGFSYGKDDFLSDFLAVVFTSISFALTKVYSAEYLQNHLLRGDANSYFYLYAKGLFSLQQEGLVEAWRYWVADNDRMPLQFGLMYVFKLLGFSNQSAVELINVFAWLFFIVVFSRSLRKANTDWWLISILLSCLIFSKFNFDPSLGAASFFPEGTSMLFFGAALISLVFSDLGRDFEQMRYFGIAASLCVLSRYVAVAYLLFATGPILIFYALVALRQRRFLRSFAPPVLLAAGIISVLAFPFLWTNLSQVVEFYRIYGYGLGTHTEAESIAYISYFIEAYYRADLFLLLFSAALAWFSLASRRTLTALSLATWVGLAHVLMMVVVLKNYDDIQTSMFLVIGFFLSLSTFMVSLRVAGKRVLVMVLLSLAFVKIAKLPFSLSSAIESSSEIDSLRFYRAVEAAVTDAVPETNTIHWAAGWAEDFVKPAYIAWKEKSKLLLSNQTYMTNHISHWKGFYPLAATAGLKDRIAGRVFSEIKFDTRVVVVRKDPEQVSFPFQNEISEYVARELSRRFKNEPTWELFRVIPEGPFGPMEVYRKKRL